MQVIITGASGMVGKGVLLECLDAPRVTAVVSIGRSIVDITHPKLTHVVHQDFSNYTTIRDYCAGCDACYLCMGVSAAGLNEEEYRTITYDYTLQLAEFLYDLNPEMTCIYVSGQGTFAESRAMWARVKAQTENALLALGFRQTFLFRPGAIIPLRGIKSRTKLYQFMYDYFLWLVKLVKLLRPSSVVTTAQIGQAMINISLQGYATSLLNPRDIIIASADNPSTTRS